MRVERPPGLDRRTDDRTASTGPGSQCVSRKLASVLERSKASQWRANASVRPSSEYEGLRQTEDEEERVVGAGKSNSSA